MVAYLDQAGVQHLIAKIRDTFWPVGTILATTNTTSPASYIGGSWEAYAPGRTLVGVSTDADFTLNKQGGAKTFSLEQNGIGAEIGVSSNGGLQWGYRHNGLYFNQFHFQETHQFIREVDPPMATGVGLIGSVSTIQPYVAVCYWRRVA